MVFKFLSSLSSLSSLSLLPSLFHHHPCLHRHHNCQCLHQCCCCHHDPHLRCHPHHHRHPHHHYLCLHHLSLLPCHPCHHYHHWHPIVTFIPNFTIILIIFLIPSRHLLCCSLVSFSVSKSWISALCTFSIGQMYTWNSLWMVVVSLVHTVPFSISCSNNSIYYLMILTQKYNLLELLLFWVNPRIWVSFII